MSDTDFLTCGHLRASNDNQSYLLQQTRLSRPVLLGLKKAHCSDGFAGNDGDGHMRGTFSHCRVGYMLNGGGGGWNRGVDTSM